MDSYYIYAGSRGSAELYSNNSPSDFICQFPEDIHMDNKWELALKEITVSIPRPDNIYEFFICADNIQPSIVNGKFMSVLNKATTYGGSNMTIHFSNDHYVKVTRPTLPSIRIYMYDTDGRPFSLEPDSVTRCTIHLRRK